MWNRTPSRADDVLAADAKLAASPREATEAGDLILVSLTDYQAMYDILSGATASLPGRTLANLTAATRKPSAHTEQPWRTSVSLGSWAATQDELS